MQHVSRFLTATGLLVAPLAVITTLSAPAATASATIDPSLLGARADTAAGSCWEIKQSRPAANDGAYWLLTPAMAEPQQFYCDMSTDGGGWVLVGKGRDGWTTDYDGKGAASDLLTPSTSPMSSSTVQLASSTVDALLNGGRVDALPDGVRLRRATNTAGTTWQETRAKYSKFGHWAWTFGAEYPLSSWSFDGSSGTGGISASFGSDQSYKRVNNVPSKANTYKAGFAFGTQVVGTSSSASFLWSATNAGGALPYTLVYLRPHILSTDPGFFAIPDGGAPGYSQPSVAKSKALADPWGVAGLAGNTAQEGSVEVQAFVQSGDNMYVGGNFATVQRDASGTGQIKQPFLAAFNVSTGDLVTSFTPALNEQVHTLTTLPNGDVVAGGEFTQANGQAATGIVALNPTTGATDPNWKVTLQDRLSGDSFRVNSMTVSGGYLYIAGAVTHFAGGSKPDTFVYSRGLGRVSVADGTPDSTWKPTMNGSVAGISMSPDGSRLYAVGYFTREGTSTANRAAAILTSPGAALASPTWTPTWSNSNNYQHTVDAVGSKIWVGGSEHSLFQFDSGTFARVTGDIMKSHGDIQKIADSNGVVYAGCHCSDYDYANAYTWPTLNADWTEANAMDWFGAWDATSGQRIKSFTPTMTMRTGTGIWAIKGDSTGVVWAGGDIKTAATASKTSQFAGGFARFPLNDSAPPTQPTNLTVTGTTATSATLSWSKSTDAVGGTRYVVLRDDRPIASTSGNDTSMTVLKGGDNRFFVRAIDKAGNYSASTQVQIAN